MCGLIARMSAKHVSGTACALGSYATDEKSGAAHRSPATDVAEINGRSAPGDYRYLMQPGDSQITAPTMRYIYTAATLK